MTNSNDIIFTDGEELPKVEIAELSPKTAAVSPELEREVAAASSIPDQLVVVPSRTRPSSIIGNLISLDVGEVFTKSEMVCDVAKLDALDGDINLTSLKERLRNNVKSSTIHAKKQINGEFAMETHHFVSPLGRLYIQVLITRTA
ncbi:hypothetical protein JT321_gp64 [Providencia phage Kokobel1]|uniref:DUF7609 domain-containing protein n=1 Tax=Providencia phage Kokobel1 TaxID=2783540 RepID=A0A873WJN7_9CAUD|nr:hypothetical protein JT321_gp64 [Providencia phage Kokobel1]QPB11491.1 hypothetical protein [Providencia phage Kokobel1]